MTDEERAFLCAEGGEVGNEIRGEFFTGTEEPVAAGDSGVLVVSAGGDAASVTAGVACSGSQRTVYSTTWGGGGVAVLSAGFELAVGVSGRRMRTICPALMALPKAVQVRGTPAVPEPPSPPVAV